MRRLLTASDKEARPESPPHPPPLFDGGGTQLPPIFKDTLSDERRRRSTGSRMFAIRFCSGVRVLQPTRRSKRRRARITFYNEEGARPDSGRRTRSPAATA